MKSGKTTIVTIAALLGGAAIGYFIHPSAPAKEPAPGIEDTNKKAKHVAGKAHNSDDAALERLRMRVKELERQLADAQRPPEVKDEAVNEPTNRPPNFRRGGPPSPAEMRAHMEEIRKNDPERYTQMTNHFANMRARQLERAQDKLDILASVDVNRLSEKQRLIHEQYQDLIARQEELRNLAFAPDDGSVTDEQRAAAHGEMHEIWRKLQASAIQEREILLSQTARSFGVKGEAGKELVETVKAVYQATETFGGHGGRHGGGPRGPGGPRR